MIVKFIVYKFRGSVADKSPPLILKYEFKIVKLFDCRFKGQKSVNEVSN